RRAVNVRDALPEAVTLPRPIAAQASACVAACRQLGALASDAAVLAQSTSTVRDAVLDALLAAVLRDPDDDEPRAIYADALEQRGDPRGELIALQLRRAKDGKLPAAAETRERELLGELARTWIAPLDAAVRADSIRFARGFL